ncbi:MAG: TIM-barrel domain-containing protein [Acidobacteriaceae bacterium]
MSLWEVALLCALAIPPSPVAAQQPASEPRTLGAVYKVETLPNGFRIETSSGGTEEIVALRDDVLRVRAAVSRDLPEDASWAVEAKARHASVTVEREDTADVVGFRTKALHIAVTRRDLRLIVRDERGKVIQEDATPLHFEGTAFRVVKSMPADEHYFGLGDKTGPLDRRNHAFTMWNTDAYRFQESTDPIYKSIPFFMTYRAGDAVGVFLDNTWRTSFDFGKESPTTYSFGSVAGPLDYYIFSGPSPREVVETYAWLTGKPPLPPRWMLGFQQSRYSYMTEAMVMEIANRLRADHIPVDALYLDIDFQKNNRPFTVNTEAFPNLPRALSALHAMHFHVVAITDLHIAHAPNQGYAPYDSGIASDEFVHRPDGSVYVGSVWPGPSVFPDFTQQSTRAWWGTLYKPFVGMGFDGFWNDMNEPSVFDGPGGTMPLDTVHRIREPGFLTRTATHGEIHNVYGMENSRATYDGLRKLQPDTRPFVLTRASYAGGQRYAATWTGDNSSTWNHLRMTSPMLKSLGLSGFSFSGADVGGYAGTPTPELLTKWIEIGAFQPIDRDHTEKGTGDQEPWVGGEQQEAIRRRYIEQRYILMPYLYTLAEETAQTGLPMMRPLFLDYPNATKDKHPIDVDPGVDTEFLLGHDLLVAPSPYPEEPDTYTVEFPSADWYNFWNGKRVTKPAQVAKADPDAPPAATDQVALFTEIHPTLDTLPVFVRAGAIIPIQPLVQSTSQTPKGPLTLRVYVGDDCHGTLYTDDGRTFAYQHGDFLRMDFACTISSEGLKITVSKREGSFVPWWTQLRFEVYGWTPVHDTVDLNGHAFSRLIEPDRNFFSIIIPDTASGTTLDLN